MHHSDYYQPAFAIAWRLKSIMFWHTLISLSVIAIRLFSGVCSSGGKELNGFMDLDFLARKAAMIKNSNATNTTAFSLQKQLVILPTSRFVCTGSISGFYLGAEVRPSGSLYPKAEVWGRVVDDRRRRRSGDDDDDGGGYYRRYSVELKPTFSDFLSEGIYLYELQSRLHFQLNDVFAIYQPEPSESRVVVQYTTMKTSISLVRSSYSSQVSLNSLDFIYNQTLLVHPITGEL